MSRDIKAGGAFVEIYLKGKQQLDAGLKNVQAKLHAFAQGASIAGTALTGISGAVLGGLGGAFASFINDADKLADTADRLGMTTTALQELQYTASQSGASLEDVEAGMKRFSATLGDAEKGEKSAIDTLNKYGLSVSRLKGMTPEQQMRALADAIARQPDQARKAAAALDLLGKGGFKLLPMLSQGAAGLDAFAKRANDLGLVRSEKDIAMGGKLADMWSTITQQARALANVIGAALAPAMEQIFGRIMQVAAAAIKFIDTNRGLVTGVAAAAIAIGAGGVALLGLAGIATIVSAIIGGIVTAFTTAAAVIGFLATPVGAIIGLLATLGTALVAGVAYWAFFTESGNTALMNLFDTASKTFGGIMDSMLAMDFGLAWNILLAGAYLEFQKFNASLVAAWESLHTTLVQIAHQIVHDIAAAMINNPIIAKLLELQGLKVEDVSAQNDKQLEAWNKSRKNAENAANAEQNAITKALENVLNGLTAQARQKRESAVPDFSNMPAFQFKMPQIDEEAINQKPTIRGGATGTFSAAVASLIGQTGDATAKETKEVGKKIDEGNDKLDGIHEVIREALDKGGLSWV
jgi:ribosomal protein S11